MQYVTEKCVIGRTIKIMSDEQEYTFLERVSLSMKSLMFAKLPGEKKLEFLSTVGQQYCCLLRSMVRNALSLVQSDTFMKFKLCLTEVKAEEEIKPIKDTKPSKRSQIDRPFWCGPKYVDKKHLDAVQRRLENVQK